MNSVMEIHPDAYPDVEGWDSQWASEGNDWRNPPYVLRLALVAVAWAFPGVMLGLMAYLSTHLFRASLIFDLGIMAVVGGVLFGTVGALLEAFEDHSPVTMSTNNNEPEV